MNYFIFILTDINQIYIYVLYVGCQNEMKIGTVNLWKRFHQIHFFILEIRIISPFKKFKK